MDRKTIYLWFEGRNYKSIYQSLASKEWTRTVLSAIYSKARVGRVSIFSLLGGEEWTDIVTKIIRKKRLMDTIHLFMNSS